MSNVRPSSLARIALVIAVSAGLASYGERPADAQAATLERLAGWVALVERHAPGERDEAADAASLLSVAELDSIRDELEEVRRLLELALSSGAGLDEPVLWNRDTITVGALAAAVRVPRADLDAAIGSADGRDAVRLVDRTVFRLLDRGALLHADVALVVPPLLKIVSAVEPDAKASLLVQDGRVAGLERTADSHVSTHFQSGSSLVDLASRLGRPSERTRLWYRATSAYLLFQEAFGDAMPYLDHARAALPTDPVIHFYTGALHEVFALPRSQAVVQSVELPAGMVHDVGTADEELRIADRHYRRALELNPEFTLAAVHRARVLGLIGDPAAARTLLTRVRPRIADRPTEYFVELFLGNAARDLDDFSGARAHYEQATALYPRAQTPGLAESALLRARGDREGAVALMRRVLGRRVGRSLTDDPWWTYHTAHVADVADQIDALRRALAGGPS